MEIIMENKFVNQPEDNKNCFYRSLSVIVFVIVGIAIFLSINNESDSEKKLKVQPHLAESKFCCPVLEVSRT